MKKLISLNLVLILIHTIFWLTACTLMAPKIRTIYVPEGDAVMLRQDVKNVDIWAKTKDNKPVAGNLTLEEGWM